MTNDNDTIIDEENEGNTEGTVTPKELAALFSSDPKTVRKFLRSISQERPGKGSRWAIRTEDVPALQERFTNWNSRSVTVLSLDDED